jgi:hypothetical protein
MEMNSEDLKPKMMYAIEHLDAANNHMNSAMNVLGSVIHDLQKGADFIARYRDSLIKTVENTGGNTTQAIESQIRDFIPKRARDGNDGQSQGG